jgi:hypothetical protein
MLKVLQICPRLNALTFADRYALTFADRYLLQQVGRRSVVPFRIVGRN